MTYLKQVKRNKESFDKEFCKNYPDGRSRFLRYRSVSEDGDKEIKSHLTTSRISELKALAEEIKSEKGDITDYGFNAPIFNKGISTAIKIINNIVKELEK